MSIFTPAVFSLEAPPNSKGTRTATRNEEEKELQNSFLFFHWKLLPNVVKDFITLSTLRSTDHIVDDMIESTLQNFALLDYISSTVSSKRSSADDEENAAVKSQNNSDGFDVSFWHGVSGKKSADDEDENNKTTENILSLARNYFDDSATGADCKQNWENGDAGAGDRILCEAVFRSGVKTVEEDLFSACSSNTRLRPAGVHFSSSSSDDDENNNNDDDDEEKLKLEKQKSRMKRLLGFVKRREGGKKTNSDDADVETLQTEQIERSRNLLRKNIEKTLREKTWLTPAEEVQDEKYKPDNVDKRLEEMFKELETNPEKMFAFPIDDYVQSNDDEPNEFFPDSSSQQNHPGLRRYRVYPSSPSFHPIPSLISDCDKKYRHHHADVLAKKIQETFMRLGQKFVDIHGVPSSKLIPGTSSSSALVDKLSPSQKSAIFMEQVIEDSLKMLLLAFNTETKTIRLDLLVKKILTSYLTPKQNIPSSTSSSSSFYHQIVAPASASSTSACTSWKIRRVDGNSSEAASAKQQSSSSETTSSSTIVHTIPSSTIDNTFDLWALIHFIFSTLRTAVKKIRLTKQAATQIGDERFHLIHQAEAKDPSSLFDMKCVTRGTISAGRWRDTLTNRARDQNMMMEREITKGMVDPSMSSGLKTVQKKQRAALEEPTPLIARDYERAALSLIEKDHDLSLGESVKQRLNATDLKTRKIASACSQLFALLCEMEYKSSAFDSVVSQARYKFNEGERLMRLGVFARAADYFSDAIELCPSVLQQTLLARSLLLRAVCYESMGSYLLAIRDCTFAINNCSSSLFTFADDHHLHGQNNNNETMSQLFIVLANSLVALANSQLIFEKVETKADLLATAMVLYCCVGDDYERKALEITYQYQEVFISHPESLQDFPFIDHPMMNPKPGDDSSQSSFSVLSSSIFDNESIQQVRIPVRWSVKIKKFFRNISGFDSSSTAPLEIDVDDDALFGKNNNNNNNDEEIDDDALDDFGVSFDQAKQVLLSNNENVPPPSSSSTLITNWNTSFNSSTSLQTHLEAHPTLANKVNPKSFVDKFASSDSDSSSSSLNFIFEQFKNLASNVENDVLERGADYFDVKRIFTQNAFLRDGSVEDEDEILVEFWKEQQNRILTKLTKKKTNTKSELALIQQLQQFLQQNTANNNKNATTTKKTTSSTPSTSTGGKSKEPEQQKETNKSENKKSSSASSPSTTTKQEASSSPTESSKNNNKNKKQSDQQKDQKDQKEKQQQHQKTTTPSSAPPLDPQALARLQNKHKQEITKKEKDEKSQRTTLEQLQKKEFDQIIAIKNARERQIIQEQGKLFAKQREDLISDEVLQRQKRIASEEKKEFEEVIGKEFKNLTEALEEWKKKSAWIEKQKEKMKMRKEKRKEKKKEEKRVAAEEKTVAKNEHQENDGNKNIGQSIHDDDDYDDNNQNQDTSSIALSLLPKPKSQQQQQGSTPPKKDKKEKTSSVAAPSKDEPPQKKKDKKKDKKNENKKDKSETNLAAASSSSTLSQQQQQKQQQQQQHQQRFVDPNLRALQGPDPMAMINETSNSATKHNKKDNKKTNTKKNNSESTSLHQRQQHREDDADFWSPEKSSSVAVPSSSTGFIVSSSVTNLPVASAAGGISHQQQPNSSSTSTTTTRQIHQQHYLQQLQQQQKSGAASSSSPSSFNFNSSATPWVPSAQPHHQPVNDSSNVSSGGTPSSTTTRSPIPSSSLPPNSSATMFFGSSSSPSSEHTRRTTHTTVSHQPSSSSTTTASLVPHIGSNNIKQHQSMIHPTNNHVSNSNPHRQGVPPSSLGAVLLQTSSSPSTTATSTTSSFNVNNNTAGNQSTATSFWGGEVNTSTSATGLTSSIPTTTREQNKSTDETVDLQKQLQAIWGTTSTSSTTTGASTGSGGGSDFNFVSGMNNNNNRGDNNNSNDEKKNKDSSENATASFLFGGGGVF